MSSAEQKTKPSLAIPIFGLVLSLGLDLLPLGRWGREHAGLGPLLGNEVLFWVAVAIVLAYVLFVERRGFSSIGFRRPGVLDLALGAVAGVALVAGIVVIYTYVFPALHLKMNAGEMSKLLQTPFWYRLLLVLRAAFNEEILFRGYPMERLMELARSRALAFLVPWAAFTYAHLASWGPAQLIVAGYGGVVLGGLYLWRRNLWANLLAHFIGDGAGFLLR